MSQGWWALPVLALALLGTVPSRAEDGYKLWLRYDQVGDPALLKSYRQTLSSFHVEGDSPTAKVIREELQRALKSLLGRDVADSLKASLVVETVYNPPPVIGGIPLDALGPEGYVISSRNEKIGTIVIASPSPLGALYGTFHFLRLLQTHRSIENLYIVEKPRVKLRVLDHWDNLDGSIERGYAGKSLWDWKDLPDHVSPRLTDYARADASVGINGAVLNNVNSNPIFLTTEYLQKAAAIAKLFRPYGIKVYLCPNFGAPKHIGALSTSDPLDPQVIAWWKAKADEIYKLIPDFGGFLVKANSEGQSGPQDYGRTHLQGANMLAEALRPHGGVVMWRSFVYNDSVDPDRINRAYKEFHPFDGKFLDNVLIQSKNGALDFQPREPFAPLFGGMKKTPVLAELQVTQEYLGHSTHLVYLGPLWEEFFQSDTYAKGPGSTVAKVVEGEVFPYSITGIAGVANTGDDRNWCGHPFAQANWYAFGRMAWNPESSSQAIAQEWAALTWGNDPVVLNTVVKMMMGSREAFVDYTCPLGLAGVFEKDVHYAPDPGMVDPRRADWSAAYYVRADAKGLGFDRTRHGSDNVDQYHPPLNGLFNDIKTCPEKYLCWFHHVPWDYRVNSGKTFWDELGLDYERGVREAAGLKTQWESLKGKVDSDRWNLVEEKLTQQVKDAGDWRDKCLKYFQGFSHMPLPSEGGIRKDKMDEPGH